MMRTRRKRRALVKLTSLKSRSIRPRMMSAAWREGMTPRSEPRSPPKSSCSLPSLSAAQEMLPCEERTPSLISQLPSRELILKPPPCAEPSGPVILTSWNLAGMRSAVSPRL